MRKIDLIPDNSALISDELKTQITTLLSKMTQKVTLKAVLDFENEKSIEMGAFLKAIAACSELLEVSFYEKEENPKLDEELHTDYLPVVGLYDEVYKGICFHGTPGGKEINSFLAAICNLGGAGNPLDKRLLKNISYIKNDLNVKIFVSLACHHCPHVVAACQKIALANTSVQAEMYDANLYPELVEKYNIQRVPMTVVNDTTVIMGEKTIEDLVNRFMIL